MQKTDTEIVFNCLECKEENTFDNVGKNQLVPGATCKNHYATTQRTTHYFWNTSTSQPQIQKTSE